MIVRTYPAQGIPSPDGVAVIGRRGYADLLMGSNHYYMQYFQHRDQQRIDALVNGIVKIRTAALEFADAAFFLAVPSKASCLSENYPYLLPRAPSANYAGLRSVFEPYGGSGFASWMLEGTFASRSGHWFRYDSHWNSRAARIAAEWVMSELGVSHRIPYRSEPESFRGDLAGRWDPQMPLEEAVQHEIAEVGANVIADNGSGLPYSANSGRLVSWAAEEPVVDGKMVIVGDSFSGAGYSPWNLTYWLSRYFRETSFVHSFNVPLDTFEELAPRFVVYQTNERFLVNAPGMFGSLAELLREFGDRHCGETL